MAAAVDDATGILNRALQLQRAGRYDDADRLYAQALEIDPGHFDALHMSGVVAYQKKDFVRARQLIEAALAVQPDSVDAMMNMELVQRAFAADNEFDRYALAHLPRYCPLGDPLSSALGDPLNESDGTVTAAQLRASFGADDVHLLVPATGVSAAVQRFVRALAQAVSPHRPVSCWSVRAAEPIAGLPAPRVVGPATAVPGGCLVVAGSDADAGAWLGADGWTSRWLFCDAPAHGPLADRLRQLSAHGRHRVELLLASVALARRLKLPGRVFVET